MGLYIAAHVGSDGHMALPEAGGLYDQPAVVMDAFAIIKHEKALFDIEQRRIDAKNRASRETQHPSQPDRPARNSTVRH